MAKAIVVYESKYGNTKLVAKMIVEGMNQVDNLGGIIKIILSLGLKKRRYLVNYMV